MTTSTQLLLVYKNHVADLLYWKFVNEACHLLRHWLLIVPAEAEALINLHEDS